MSGTELSMAYGSPYENVSNTRPTTNKMPQPKFEEQRPVEREEPVRKIDLPLPKLTSSPIENINYKVPNDIYASQGNSMLEIEAPKYRSDLPRDSFWDKIGRKKFEVLKVFVLALVIVLGISIDHFSKYYLDNYIGKSFLTETQELLVRLSYPVMVILIIWIIKSLS
jgi:hypothetical protein